MANLSLVDRSGALTGSSQSVLTTNPDRKGWRLMNTGNADLWFNDTGGAASVGGAGCYKLVAGAYFETAPNLFPIPAVAVIGTAAQTFSASEW